MQRDQESPVPPGVLTDRRSSADRRRLRELGLSRVLGAAPAGRPGFLAIRALDDHDAPVLVSLSVEAAMTLLNDLQRISNEEDWFKLDSTAT